MGNEEEDYNKNFDSLKAFGEENNLNKCFRTSGLNGYGVEDSLNYLITEIVGSVEIKYKSSERRNSITLNKELHKESIRKEKKCC